MPALIGAEIPKRDTIMAQTILWPPADPLPTLLSGQVHVCAWDLDVPPSPGDWKILGEDEILRAKRFVFPQHRDRYVRAHSTMRRLLGHYSSAMPGNISFSSNAYGKPEIENNPEHLRFNLTHSDGLGMLAVARGYELGIDVELLRPIDQEIAEHHFSPAELAGLRGLPAGEWLAGFYRCWTSKEAILKGEGFGLNRPLDAFDVEVDPARPAALLDIRPTARLAHGWQLIDLRPGPEAVGTLAVREQAGALSGEQFTVRCFSLNG